MSIDYNFEIETTLSPKQVLQIAAKANGAEVIDADEPYSFRVRGAFAVTTKIDNEIGRKVMLEAYGFAPSAIITFRYRIPEDTEGKHSAIARGAAAMLHEILGKAVLLYNGEETLVQRLNGCLLTDDPRYDWLAKGFDEFGLKYERRPLESPLL